LVVRTDVAHRVVIRPLVDRFPRSAPLGSPMLRYQKPFDFLSGAAASRHWAPSSFATLRSTARGSACGIPTPAKAGPSAASPSPVPGDPLLGGRTVFDVNCPLKGTDLGFHLVRVSIRGHEC
jgi:hypothetical protein